MSVAALAIAISSFGQNVLSSKDSTLINQIEIINNAQNINSSIHQDVVDGKIYKEYANGYVENLQEIIARARKLRENE